MVFRHCLINDISWFKIQGPNDSININIMRGPRRVETKVVSRGERYNQDSTHPVGPLIFSFAVLVPLLLLPKILSLLLCGPRRNNTFFPEPRRPHPAGERLSLTLSYFAKPLQIRMSKTFLSD